MARLQAQRQALSLQFLLVVVIMTLLVERAAAFIPRLPILLQQLSRASSSPLKMVAVDDSTTLVGMTHEEYIGTLPDQAKTMMAEWQYLLVERLEPPTQTQGGLFLPSTDQDPLHMVRIVSIGSGLVGESGVLTQIENLKAGDVAMVKQPWGIGPRDETWEGRKFSFIRSHDVLSRIEATKE